MYIMYPYENILIQSWFDQDTNFNINFAMSHLYDPDKFVSSMCSRGRQVIFSFFGCCIAEIY